MILVEGAGLAPALPDLRPRQGQHLFVIAIFPNNQIFDDLEQSLAFGSGLLLVHPTTQMPLIAGIIDHLRKNHSPRGS
ncbi:hypothetical protein B479_23115 [Pseudomonas putida HB3267]|nr:hypothetical protein B479_23115 [Pseudomonas putida HB3267]